MTEDDVRKMLRADMANAGGLRAWARLKHIPSSRVSEFETGRRQASMPILVALGLTKAIVPLDSRAGDAGEVAQVIRWIDEAIERARKRDTAEGIWLYATQWQTVRNALAATPAPAVDAECQLCHGLNTSCPNGCEIIHDAIDAVPAGEVEQ